MPHGPARFGPMRFCMSLMSLRSNQIMNMHGHQQEGEGNTDLDEHDQHVGQVDAVGEQRVHQASPATVSTRRR